MCHFVIALLTMFVALVLGPLAAPARAENYEWSLDICRKQVGAQGPAAVERCTYRRQLRDQQRQCRINSDICGPAARAREARANAPGQAISCAEAKRRVIARGYQIISSSCRPPVYEFSTLKGEAVLVKFDSRNGKISALVGGD